MGVETDLLFPIDQQEELALGLGIEEQCAGADVRLVGDLLRRDLFDAVLGEQLARRGNDPFELLLLVALAPAERLGGEGHDASSGDGL